MSTGQTIGCEMVSVVMSLTVRLTKQTFNGPKEKVLGKYSHIAGSARWQTFIPSAAKVSSPELVRFAAGAVFEKQSLTTRTAMSGLSASFQFVHDAANGGYANVQPVWMLISL